MYSESKTKAMKTTPSSKLSTEEVTESSVSERGDVDLKLLQRGIYQALTNDYEGALATLKEVK